jgi:hypothetical protein
MRSGASALTALSPFAGPPAQHSAAAAMHPHGAAEPAAMQLLNSGRPAGLRASGNAGGGGSRSVSPPSAGVTIRRHPASTADHGSPPHLGPNAAASRSRELSPAVWAGAAGAGAAAAAYGAHPPPPPQPSDSLPHARAPPPPPPPQPSDSLPATSQEPATSPAQPRGPPPPPEPSDSLPQPAPRAAATPPEAAACPPPPPPAPTSPGGPLPSLPVVASLSLGVAEAAGQAWPPAQAQGGEAERARALAAARHYSSTNLLSEGGGGSFHSAGSVRWTDVSQV